MILRPGVIPDNPAAIPAYLRAREQDIMRRLALTHRYVFASEDATPDDRILFVDSTAGAVVVTLPHALTCYGMEPIIVKRVAGANAVTVTTVSGALIDGAAPPLAIALGGIARLFSDGTDFHTL